MLFGKIRPSAQARETISKSGIFDEGWYLKTYKDVRSKGVDALDHYIRFGADEDRNPNLLFDTRFYKRQAMLGGINPLVHYLTIGERAGLSPSIFFPTQWYLEKYPDLKKAGVSALSHFMLDGAKEHRDPNPLFDTAWIIREFNFTTGVEPSAFHYFMANWRAEKLRPNPLFDPLWYLNRYPDLAQAGVDPFSHYLISGGLEGRSPHPLFEAGFYLATYPDVAEAKINPLAHYLDHGRFEARSINRYFDASWYLSSYPDVQRARIDPVRHYVEHGAAEGRNPSPRFDSAWYLETYPDVAATNANPLTHFLAIGEQEGRAPLDPNVPFTNYNLSNSQRNVAEKAEIANHIAVMSWRPRFAIVSMKNETLISPVAINSQPYPSWEAVKSDRGLKLAEVNAEYFIFLETISSADARLLYDYASYIIAHPEVDILYCDMDYVDADGVHVNLFFKPDWSPDYLEVFNYIGYGACYSANLVKEHWAQSKSYYDFVLRATEGKKKIHHLRDVLCHLQLQKGQSDQIPTKEALAGRLGRTGRDGIPVQLNDAGYYKMTITRSTTPLISVVIPTAGKAIEIEGQKIDLIVNCIDSILSNSTYKNLEFIVVDNGDLHFQQRRRLAAMGVKRVTYKEPVFNVSKKLNLGVRSVSGDILLLMNDDIEPLTADWIEILLNELDKPWVGVAGPKLLFPDETIQHAGVILHDGNPDHVRKFYPRDDEGYFGSTCANHNYVAVTGACMMTRTDLYREVGGYNEQLAISYNDVDYCFKVRERGYSAVYAAGAELTHFESQSRAPRLDLAESEYFHWRWRQMLGRDPFYNGRMLSTAPPNYRIVNQKRAF